MLYDIIYLLYIHNTLEKSKSKTNKHTFHQLQMSGTVTGAGILFYVILFILFILLIVQCRSTVQM